MNHAEANGVANESIHDAATQLSHQLELLASYIAS